MKKICIFALFFVVFINSVNAVELCTPSEEYLKYMNLSEEDKLNYVEPPYCKELMVQKEETNGLASFLKNVITVISASSTDTYYNAANYGIINPSEIQGSLGTCWAFSSISTVEANAKKNNIGNYNFSESHMVYSVLGAGYYDQAGKKGKYYTSNFDGGKVTYAASYYFNNYGQLLESDMPYSDIFVQMNSSSYPQGRKMISVGSFELANIKSYSVCTADEMSYIKKQIINHGSVQASMYMNESLFKDSGRDYYISTTSSANMPNHGISIIGWDDRISKTNFGASRDGAWIVKNSWGPNWSNDGLFYISYDDHFICKNTASFYDVSTKTFDNSYKSADMVGVPTFTFSGNLYTSAKFTKKTSNPELLKRVSFPIGENSRYKVYLVSDNNYYNQSNWILLTSGTTTTYGIKSVDLNNITINSDFTIVVKYESTNTTSVFTMCNNVEDTSQMEYGRNTNYYSVDGVEWNDLANMSIGNTSISCEPNIFAYTNNTAAVEGSVTINSGTTSNGNIVVTMTRTNVDTNQMSYSVTNTSNTNMSNHFTITPRYNTSGNADTITITPDGKVSGNFVFRAKYGNKEATYNFSLTEKITSNNTSFINIKSDKLYVTISNNYVLTYQKLLAGLTISNSEVQILNPNGNVITSTSSVVSTNAKLKLNNNTYLIVVLGDVNCDGKISALDYIEVRKHIMGTSITNNGKLLASDLDQNNKITALDYIAIRKILMR